MKLIFRCLAGAVWFANGLLCKVLDLVPRHREIVGEILGFDHAGPLTLVIGFGEVLLAFWIWSGVQTKFCGWLQIALVLAMNVIEQIVVTGKLLWGPWNFLWALLFSALVWWAFIQPEGKRPC